MFSLTVENRSGQRLTLTHRENEYQVINVDGLNPPKAIIQSNNVVSMDGARFASSKLEPRNVVLTIKINGDVESNRLRLYRYFKTKQYSKIYYKNSSRSIYCEGYVETIECDLFENGQTMQVSIICHDPYLNDLEEIVYDLSQVIGMFEFPFSFGGSGVLPSVDDELEQEYLTSESGDDLATESNDLLEVDVFRTMTDDAIEFSILERQNFINIINTGDVDSGFIAELTASGTVVNPVIYNLDENSSFGVNCTLIAGDVLIIDTISGEKSVKLIRNGETQNYLRHVKRGSKWLVVNQGDNQYTYDAETGGDLIQMLVKFRTKYEAV